MSRRYTHNSDGEPDRPRMQVVRDQDPPKKSSCLGAIVVFGMSVGVSVYEIIKVVSS